MNRNSKLLAVVSYITWIGWLIAFFKRDREDSLVRRHLNQSLALNLAASAANLLSRIGGIFYMVGVAATIAVLVLEIMGVLRAFRMSEEPLPLVGNFNWIS